MSDPLRLALICEGPTDRIFLESAIQSMLGSRRFILRQLQPEESIPLGRVGAGWPGVFRWCQSAIARNSGHLSGDILFLTYDILIIHLDADVADVSAENARRHANLSNNELPCALPCPPASATTDRLRSLLLRILGETGPPPRTVFCTPSKSMEAWVLSSLFPHDSLFAQHGECLENPENRLSQQPLGARLSKNRQDFDQKRAEFEARWPQVWQTLSEAARFKAEFLSALPAPPPNI